MNTTTETLYGIWITNKDGSNGRWMSDVNNGKDRWETPSKFEACSAVRMRGGYGLNYEVKELETK